MKKKRHLNMKAAAVCAQGLIMLLTSCASVVGPGTGSAPSDTADDPTESAVTTTVATDAVSAIVTTDAESGAQTVEKKLWDPDARAAAIEAILSKLPERPAGEEFELKVNDGFGTVLVSGTKYLTRSARYEKIQSSGGVLGSVEKEASVTVAQNTEDGSLRIAVIYSQGKNALAVTVTPDENFFQKIKDSYGSSGIIGYIFKKEVRTEDLRESLLFTGYQAEPFGIIIAEVSNMLSELDPDISLETFGVYDRLPEETNVLPAGADFLFGDERYRVELNKNDDGSLKTLRLSAEKGNPVEFPLHDGSVDLFVFAYRDADGGIRVVIFYEHLYKTSSGTPTLRLVYGSYDCDDGSLIPASGDGLVDSRIDRRDDLDLFFDPGRVYNKCRERSERALTEARAKATDCLIVFDYYSGRDESLNRYMTPGEIPENADWKIADTLDIR